MNNNIFAPFMALNILLTGGLCYFVVTNQEKNPGNAAGRAEIKVDISAFQKPLTELTDKVDQLNKTVQRFSTSYVQYDFLKREMDRLSVVDQNIGVRAQATAASKTDKNAKEVDEVISKLSNLSQQVKGQLQTRRQTMLKLISGLENELASISAPRPPVKKPALASEPTDPSTANTQGIPEGSKTLPTETSDSGAATSE
tara:strand:- start:11335 stop:11931 length:597 start_codon:yes stop_codon:yes gene_type:complete